MERAQSRYPVSQVACVRGKVLALGCAHFKFHHGGRPKRISAQPISPTDKTEKPTGSEKVKETKTLEDKHLEDDRPPSEMLDSWNQDDVITDMACSWDEPTKDPTAKPAEMLQTWETRADSPALFSGNEGDDEEEGSSINILTERNKKRKRQSDNEDDEEEQTINEEERMKKAQLHDGDIQAFIKLVELGKKPLFHEVRPLSKCAISLWESFDALVNIGGVLYKRSFDERGDKINLVVVPDSATERLLRRIHKKFCHLTVWRLQRHIANTFYVYNLKALSKKISATCPECILAAAPKLAPARKIKIFCREPGNCVATDVVQMPADQGYKYILVVYCMASAYIFAQKMKTKTGEEVAKNYQLIMYRNCITFPNSVSDKGTEYTSKQFKELIASTGANHTYLHAVRKNASLGEVAAARLLNVLRKHLAEGESWVSQLDKVLYAMNSSSFKYTYGKTPIVSTPNYLLNARSINVVPWKTCIGLEEQALEKEESVREIMDKIADERLLESESLLANVLSRNQVFKAGDKVLVFREQVEKKRKSNAGELRAKLKKFWCVAEIIDRLDDGYLIKAAGEQSVRRVNRRELRQIPHGVEFPNAQK